MTASKLPLVRPKLLVPASANLLHRPRVCRAIERGLETKLTIVSAPAGYGKTSALVDFVRHIPIPVCWYTADEWDRDLGAFVEYLVGAIGERFSGFGERTREALNLPAADLFRDPIGVVGELANEMLELDTPFVVVVDNYEVLDGALGIRLFIHRLLEVLPPNCHLMLGSRVLPDVPVTWLVAKRQLVGLTDRDLRFTPEEIQDLLRRSQIEVSEKQAKAIAARSEGWVTGVLLLADLLREEAETALLGTEGATAEAYIYLAREVLSRQPPDIQHFLRTSATLREMSLRLCREVLRVGDPRALLAEVERRNLFITRFGKGGAATYRYHNLFRDFLHEQLRQCDPTRYTDLHLRAAEWFGARGDVEEAVYHYLAAEAFREATALMERVAVEWFTRGRVETLLHWVAQLPEEMRTQTPRLSLFQSRVLTDRYDYEGARQALAYAEAGFAARSDLVSLAKVHSQRATLSLFAGRYEEAITEAQAALKMVGQDELIEQANARRQIGRAHVGLGHLAEGIDHLQKALDLFRQVGSLYDVANLLRDLAAPLVSLGRLDEAAAHLNEALAIGRRLGALTPLAGVLNDLGCLHYERGEYREALSLYAEGSAAARAGSDLRLQAYISVGMADLYRDLGAYEHAGPLYNVGWQLVRESEAGLAVYILAAQADMYRWQGDHTRAHVLLREAYRLAEEKDLEFERRGLLPVTEGILHAESGEIEEGLRLLADAVRFLEQRQAKRELARARFLLAKAHLLAGEKPQALTELRRAMDLAREIGTDQFAVVEGQHAEDLLRLGVAEGVTACRAVLERVQELRDFGQSLIGAEQEEEKRVGRLEIYALGGGRVLRDGHEITSSEWQAISAKELFFYILLHGPLERDAIGLVFWPDLSTKKMTDNFHTTLYRIRRAVGADAVVVEEGRYRLGDVDYWFDAEEFERLVERARLLPPHDWQAEDLWRRAVALYRGDFLPEVDRLWCVPKREALREMYLEALVGVGRCHEARREWEEAVEWYRRALEVDELREDVHQRIMQCYEEAGRRAEALAQYDRCREAFKQELDIEPSLETRKLYERIAGKGPG